jgi:hypothetical protein
MVRYEYNLLFEVKCIPTKPPIIMNVHNVRVKMLCRFFVRSTSCGSGSLLSACSTSSFETDCPSSSSNLLCRGCSIEFSAYSVNFNYNAIDRKRCIRSGTFTCCTSPSIAGPGSDGSDTSGWGTGSCRGSVVGFDSEAVCDIGRGETSAAASAVRAMDSSGEGVCLGELSAVPAFEEALSCFRLSVRACFWAFFI